MGTLPALISSGQRGRLGYRIAAFVRNPYDRVYSEFMQILREVHKQPPSEFPSPWSKGFGYAPARGKLRAALRCYGDKQIVDFIGHVETFNQISMTCAQCLVLTGALAQLVKT